MKRILIWLAISALMMATPLTSEAETVNWNENTSIDVVMAYSGFGDWGRLIFPADEGYYSGSTLKDLRLTWYSNIQPAKTVEIVNYFKEKADSGETVFYDIYTDAEKAADPWKADTGLFFFKGNPGAKFAICNAGGGFAYVGAMHDSFPHALELSKKGYNAFALIYRPGAQTPARIWRGPSPSSTSTRRSWRWMSATTPSGAAARARGWRRGWAATAQRPLVRRNIPAPAR